MTQPPTYGSHHPYPLSQMRTKLSWEDKDDKSGQHREMNLAGCEMSIQKIYKIRRENPCALCLGMRGESMTK